MSFLHAAAKHLNAMRVVDYYLCWKDAEAVLIGHDAGLNEDSITFIDPETGTSSLCDFVWPGNPFQLPQDTSKRFPIVPGGTTTPSDSAALSGAQAAQPMLTSLTYGALAADGTFVPKFVATDMTPFTPDTFISIMTDSQNTYERFVALFDDDTHAIGSDLDDRIETGAGNDVVEAGAGDDTVLKWAAGDLDYHGGSGFDTLNFAADVGSYFPNPRIGGAVVDLKSGTGTSPYGGTLSLHSVERIIGTDQADLLKGSSAAEWFETQDYGADKVVARGGDDTIVIWPFAVGCTVDGGGGTDTLKASFAYLANRLDLVDPSSNTGLFAGGSVKNVEVFDFSSSSFDPATTIAFLGSNDAETVRISGNRVATLSLRGGDDFAYGGGGDDHIGGGGGRDRIEAGGGDDDLNGGSGNDVLAGYTGNDLLDGEDGNDWLYGGSGRDRLTGGAGHDHMSGGGQADVFVFADGFGRDTITDFAPGEDRLDFRHDHAVGAGGPVETDTAQGVEIADDAGNRVLLLGVFAADLHDGDILARA